MRQTNKNLIIKHNNQNFSSKQTCLKQHMKPMITFRSDLSAKTPTNEQSIKAHLHKSRTKLYIPMTTNHSITPQLPKTQDPILNPKNTKRCKIYDTQMIKREKEWQNGEKREVDQLTKGKKRNVIPSDELKGENERGKGRNFVMKIRIRERPKKRMIHIMMGVPWRRRKKVGGCCVYIILRLSFSLYSCETVKESQRLFWIYLYALSSWCNYILMVGGPQGSSII